MKPKSLRTITAGLALLAMGGSALADDGDDAPICLPFMTFDADAGGWYTLSPDGSKDESLWREGIGVGGSGALLLPKGVTTIQRDVSLDYNPGPSESLCIAGKALAREDEDARVAVFWVDEATSAGCGGDCASTRYLPRSPCLQADVDGFRAYRFTAPVFDSAECDLDDFVSISIDHQADFIVDSIGYFDDRSMVCLEQCSQDSQQVDCDDADTCTTDVCIDGICDNRPVYGCCETDADCFDGRACTSETCSGGLCDYAVLDDCCELDADCDDGDGCTINRCDVQTHTCAEPVVDPCMDDDLCTTDSCEAGSCVHVPEADCCAAHADCDDRNPCTIDRCDEGSCSYATAPAGLPCEYVDACSFGDVCDGGGLCVTPNPETNNDCDDGDLCNGVEMCRADGSCQDGTPMDCDDGVACTVDVCEPGGVCQSTADDSLCDDALDCTIERCDPETGCESTPSSALCDDGVACTRDVCDPIEGCDFQPVSAACDDGVACTVDACDPDLGCVLSFVDAACDDGNPCTTDTCGASGCVHSDNGTCAAECGDGVCALGEETCATCPGDCGVCPEGDCCARRADAGCGSHGVEVCVCAADPYCCEVQWDDACAARVAELGCGTCENASVCGDTVCDAGEDCGSCAADCGACVEVCGDEICQVGEDCADCPVDCGVCPSNCCSEQATAGCDAADVAACVCAEDDYCCTERWDAACAASVEPSGCGMCIASGVCGDGVCDGVESCASCALDCGACPPTCDDGTCEPGETCLSCGRDCGVCPPPEPCLAALGVSCDDFEQAYLKASNTDASDYFGYAVDIDGDWIVVGAQQEDGLPGSHGSEVNTALSSGAAYVFHRVGGTWEQVAYLKASNSEQNDEFGSAVAISGTRIVVGAPYEDSATSDPDNNSALSSGAAYVFDWSGTDWEQVALLKADHVGAYDRFGISVAVSGTTVVVGAPYEDSDGLGPSDNSASSAGAAYVFLEDRPGRWGQEAYLKASNVDGNDRFGTAVAVAGDVLVVGAPYEASRAAVDGGNPTDNAATYAGAAYVFERSGGTWSEIALLKAHNAEGGDRFGTAVAMTDDLLVVGAPYESSASATHPQDNSAGRAGAAYVFAAASGWSEEAYVKADTIETGDQFGRMVDVDGAALVVGSLYEDGRSRGIGGDPTDNGASNAGAVEVYERALDFRELPDLVYDWRHRAQLKASNTASSDYFGAAVGVAGDTLVVGAYGEDSAAVGVDGDQTDNTKSMSGAVYVRKIAP